MKDKCTKCPECGCEVVLEELSDTTGKGYRVCADCDQEWWTDIEYKTNARSEWTGEGALINRMPYKPNRLRAKRKAISEKRSAMGKRGNEVKRRRMQERGQALEVVGGFRTFGCMGEHLVELLDGELRTPRTVRGVYKVLSEWISRK